MAHNDLTIAPGCARLYFVWQLYWGANNLCFYPYLVCLHQFQRRFSCAYFLGMYVYIIYAEW